MSFSMYEKLVGRYRNIYYYYDCTCMVELGKPLFIVYGCTRDLLLIKLESVNVHAYMPDFYISP